MNWLRDKRILISFLIFSFLGENLWAKTIGDVIESFTENFIVKITELMLSLAFMFFFWNIFHFVLDLSSGDYQKYKKRVLWSIVIIFVLVSFWGILKFMSDSVKLDNNPGGLEIQTGIDW